MTDFVLLLQASLSPIVLISGVGLILLTLNNRISRTIDNTRRICREISASPADAADGKREDLVIFYSRCKLLRLSAVALTASILTSSLVIPVLMWMHVAGQSLYTAGVILLSVSIGGIVFCAFSLLIDYVLTLKVLARQVDDALRCY